MAAQVGTGWLQGKQSSSKLKPGWWRRQHWAQTLLLCCFCSWRRFCESTAGVELESCIGESWEGAVQEGVFFYCRWLFKSQVLLYQTQNNQVVEEENRRGVLLVINKWCFICWAAFRLCVYIVGKKEIDDCCCKIFRRKKALQKIKTKTRSQKEPFFHFSLVLQK